MSQKTIYLDRNENNYGPAPACFEALRKADLTTLSWYDRAFVKGIKGVLSSRLAEDFQVPEDRILLGYGAETILKQIVQCYLGKGQKLMVPAYSWWYYKLIASEVGSLSVEYPMVVGDEQFQYDLNAMRELYARERPDMVFISSPNNPTGNSLPIDDLKDILAVYRNSIVVLDEAYKYNGHTDYVKDLVYTNPNLLVVRTFSKYYALAGMRIGFAIMGTNLTALAKFANRYLGFNRLAEDVAIAALDSRKYYVEIARKMQEDKDLYYAEMNKFPGVRVFRSDANFILAEIPRAHMEPLQKYLKERGLIIKFMNEALLNSHVRITLGTQEENRKLIDAMKSYFG
ncbi:MAG TPA: histidinol-phosphate transaminase [Bacteroidota bacterium]|nr:histidinol-phosphate transaminase [Bacteroidota bacterium]